MALGFFLIQESTFSCLEKYPLLKLTVSLVGTVHNICCIVASGDNGQPKAQIANLFDVGLPAISKHLKNIFTSEELDINSVYSILEYTANDGKVYNTGFYNLDAILSIGYRVNSKNATLFRQWANKVLKEYLLRRHTLNYRFELIEEQLKEHKTILDKHENKIDFFVRTSLPPFEGVFHDGQIFDAYTFVTNLIKNANKSIILIDNYIDESVLLMLSKRKSGVTADTYTYPISKALRLDLQKHNAQYSPINIHNHTTSHDRFLIIDNTDVYHIGASLKDLGKKLFAFSKLNIPPSAIL